MEKRPLKASPDLEGRCKTGPGESICRDARAERAILIQIYRNEDSVRCVLKLFTALEDV